jgi:lipopolysaccharide export system protein LptA
MNKYLLAMAACLLACGAALAEKADSNKPVTIQADTGVANMVTQGATVEGNVVMTRGTLIMKSGKATLTEDPEGYKSATLFAAPGSLATFRQKRDGGDYWVEGEAERIEYDGKNEVLKLFSKAKVAQLDGAKVTQRAEGAFISYDSRKEEVAALNTPTGQSKVGGGRVEMTFDTKPKAAPAAPGKP